MQNSWDTRFASCEACEEEWNRDLPMNGDVVVCELHTGLWLEGTVQSIPRITAWQSLARVDMPPPPTDAAASSVPKAPIGIDNPMPILFSSRARKRPQLYDASTTRRAPRLLPTACTRSPRADAHRPPRQSRALTRTARVACSCSTEYTRALRKKEDESEDLRKNCVVVDFEDGISRCVKVQRASPPVPQLI